MNQKENNTLLSHIVPLLGWVAVIQYASSQSYEEQNVTPILGNINLAWVESAFGWVSFTYGTSVVSLETSSTEQFVEFFIRKGAHVFVYFVLAVLVYRVVRLWLGDRIPEAAVIAILCTTLYAAYDEVRHYFHPNRSGMVEDVLLDMAGGAVGVLCWILLTERKKKRQAYE
ncbi:VanZ family protein [Bacillus sp. H-16]|uniref:VanZ family protein n=1 Tax=Alteribacter salitolerans TaxID=2912333 RepID=UPI001966A046|nr:VanZ family protein [Alteribacter salitolerans]MBM7095657.1 VanZ family protein [Alteribacter salitolerans]